MTSATRSRAATLTGRALVVAGCTILAIYVALLGIAYSGTYSTDHTTSGGTVYLNGGVRDNAQACLVTPAMGEPRTIAIPAMPNRGVHIHGVRIDPWFAGSAAITCGDAVHMTTGPIIRLYPLVEQWIVLLMGLLLICGGLSRLGLFRHVSRGV